MRILLIEDDKRLAILTKKVLEAEGFDVDISHNGDEGVELALRGVYDVAVIDWMLPGRDGPSVVQAMRTARLFTAVLMLTARTQVEDRVAGLYSGADDYLTKPFSYDELIARIYALSRRHAPSAAVNPSELRVGKIVLDTRTHTARRAEHILDLTKTEWTLLECLMRHPGQTLSRQFIMDYVWSYESSVQPTMVDVYISYLRNKLSLPEEKDPVKTKRGVGYYLDKNDA
ncbi:MAG: response regulator transcription factor [Anaerolineae bacterium]|jgi:two-component system, OmpR family, response regulator|nr:response regulator transcription factor [Anaerolineae bacterium]MBT7073968.1 response regulator transcription factor [Anaerolineae bacterium]MBT7781850.1 response regulator transcription factor [Anaerolineae bacterium]